MSQKPRTTRKRAKKDPKSNQSNNTEATYLNGWAYNAVSTLSVPQKVGLTVSAMALISTAVIRLSSSNHKSKSSKQNKGKSPMTPFGESSTSTGGKKIATAEITKAFQACLSAKRPQQQLVADQFYTEINKWSSEQLEIAGQTIVVNFLFWYYRSANVPETRFKSEQAEHIRYWADFPITKDVKWDYYNIKFDYMYSTALLQRSIPHMRRFYTWVCGETPRALTVASSKSKPNYHLTKYQCACILGDWQALKQIGQVIADISAKATSANATRNDYFMHYTLRALEMPASNPNFGLIYKMVDKLAREFPLSMLPPPIFAKWNILSFKYRNSKVDTATANEQEFIFASDKIKDEEGYYMFYPQSSLSHARINKKVNIWGRVCQIVSPVFGAAGFLPLTGCWSDTLLYLETKWTFRGAGNRLTRKHVIMRVERIPFEEEVKGKDYFGKAKLEKGYKWTGFITVHMQRLKKGLTIKDLYDNNNNTENTENGETQVYECQLIINTEDPQSSKDKELREKIFAASNNSTPR